MPMFPSWTIPGQCAICGGSTYRNADGKLLHGHTPADHAPVDPDDA